MPYGEEKLNNIIFEINVVLDLTFAIEESGQIQIEYIVSNNPDITIECQETIEIILETVIDIVDQAKTRHKLTYITPNVLINPNWKPSKGPLESYALAQTFPSKQNGMLKVQ